MNVSMQDTFNLGWKLVHVLQGRADASLLRSYSKERLTEAKRLVDTDHEWARIMSAPTTQAEREGREEPRIIRQFKANLEFTGGTAVKYDHSTLFADPARTRRSPGARRSAAAFTRRPWCGCPTPRQMQLGHVAEADARWRLYAFAGHAPTARRRARRSTAWPTGSKPTPARRCSRHTAPRATTSMR
jgi:phenol 2-monooxygenase